MREKVEAALGKIKPSLGGTDVVIKDISEGVVRIQILTPSCGPGMSKEMVLEVLEEQLGEMPEIKKVIAI